MRKSVKAFAIALLLAFALAPDVALAQAAILQGGPSNPGHIPRYSQGGYGQPILRDGGGSGGAAVGVNPTEFGVTSQSQTNTYPSSNSGNGPNAEHVCYYDGPVTNATGAHYLCFDPNAGGGALISYGSIGSASTLPLQFKVNGSVYQFPFSMSGIVGPGSTTLGNLSCWNNTVGSLLKDCGTPGPLATFALSGGTGVVVSNSGTPSVATTLPSGLTIPNPTLTTPALGTPASGNLANTTGYPFLGLGSGAIATTMSARMQAGALYATDYMTPAQIADGTSRTDSIDVAAALNTCIAEAVARGKACYLPSGTWKVTSAQLVMDYPGYVGAFLSNGVCLTGDGHYSSAIDFRGGSANPSFIIKSSGGQTGTGQQSSSSYSCVRGVALIGNINGPILQDGQAFNGIGTGFADAMNQQTFQDISIQNFATTSGATCGLLAAVYSPTFVNVNCATGAGVAGGNSSWIWQDVEFGSFMQWGGSNSQYELTISTTGTSDGNGVYSWDCEVVGWCINNTSPNTIENSWYAGTWAYSNFGVINSSLGADNNIFSPNINATAANFFGSGGSISFYLWNYSTYVNVSGVNNWTNGPNIFQNGILYVKGSGAGSTAINSANAGGSTFTLTLPAVNDTFAGVAAPQALTNKQVQFATYVIGTNLPSCIAGTVGNVVAVSNGIAAPTYHQVVSTTGTSTWTVTCTYNGSSYNWVY